MIALKWLAGQSQAFACSELLVDLLPIINEFKEHGVCTDRIIVGGDFDLLPKEAMVEIYSHLQRI